MPDWAFLRTGIVADFARLHLAFCFVNFVKPHDFLNLRLEHGLTSIAIHHGQNFGFVALNHDHACRTSISIGIRRHCVIHQRRAVVQIEV